MTTPPPRRALALTVASVAFAALLLELLLARIFPVVLGDFSSFLAVPATMLGLGLGAVITHLVPRTLEARSLAWLVPLLLVVDFVCLSAEFRWVDSVFGLTHRMSQNPIEDAAKIAALTTVMVPALRADRDCAQRGLPVRQRGHRPALRRRPARERPGLPRRASAPAIRGPARRLRGAGGGSGDRLGDGDPRARAVGARRLRGPRHSVDGRRGQRPPAVRPVARPRHPRASPDPGRGRDVPGSPPPLERHLPGDVADRHLPTGTRADLGGARRRGQPGQRRALRAGAASEREAPQHPGPALAPRSRAAHGAGHLRRSRPGHAGAGAVQCRTVGSRGHRAERIGHHPGDRRSRGPLPSAGVSRATERAAAGRRGAQLPRSLRSDLGPHLCRQQWRPADGPHRPQPAVPRHRASGGVLPGPSLAGRCAGLLPPAGRPEGRDAQASARRQGDRFRRRRGDLRAAESTLAPGARHQDPAIAELAARPADSQRLVATDDRPYERPLRLAGFQLRPDPDQLQDLVYTMGWTKIVTVLLYTALTGLLLLALLLRRRDGRRLPWRLTAYFLLTGIAYMGVQIGLMAKLELLMGRPLISIAVVLAGFLLFNAVGSALTDRRAAAGSPLVIRTLAVGSAAAVIVGLLGAEALVHFGLALPLAAKATLGLLVVAPTGIALGTLYPTGVRLTAEAGRSGWIPATFALAALSSVLGGTWATVAVLNLGFRTVVLGVLPLYGVVALLRLGPPRS